MAIVQCDGREGVCANRRCLQIYAAPISGIAVPHCQMEQPHEGLNQGQQRPPQQTEMEVQNRQEIEAVVGGEVQVPSVETNAKELLPVKEELPCANIIDEHTMNQLVINDLTEQQQKPIKPLSSSGDSQPAKRPPFVSVEKSDTEKSRERRGKPRQSGNKLPCFICSTPSQQVEAKYISLHDFRTRRFLCQSCLAPTDRFLLPADSNYAPESLPTAVSEFMGNITVNKDRPDRKLLKTRVERIFQREINRRLTAFLGMLSEQTRQLKREIAMQFGAVTHTFDAGTIACFIDKIREQGQDQRRLEEIELLVNTLKYSGCRNFGEVDVLMKAVETGFEQIGMLIEREQKEVHGKMEGLVRACNRWRIGRLYEDLKTKNEREKTSGDGEGETKDKEKSENVLIIDIDDEAADNLQATVLPPVVPQLNPAIHKNVTFNLPEKPQSLSSVPPLPLANTSTAPVRSPRPKASKSSSSQVYTVQVRIDNCETIWQRELKNSERIRRVVLYFQSREQRTLKSMAMCGKLQQIVIYDARMAKKEMVKFYLETFPELTHLQLNCENDFDASCVDKLTKRTNADRMERVSIGSNYHRCMAYLDERRHYPEDSHKQRTTALPNKETEMLLSLPNLQNVWIDDPDFETISKFKELGSIRFLSLGRMDTTNENFRLQRRTWELLSKFTGLSSIALNKIQLQSDLFETMLIRNKQTLETLSLHDCRRLKDHSLTVMRENLALRELAIHRGGEIDFKGDDIWQMVSLQTLVLRECPNMDVERAVQKAKCLLRLTHLTLLGCIWLTDDLVKQFCTIRSLTQINLGNTNVNSHSAGYLKSLPNLRALHVGSTKIKGVYIADLAKSLKVLQKLNVKGLGVSDNVSARGTINSKQLQQIGNYLGSLTHLDVGGCMNIDDSALESFARLKFVNVWMAPGISKAKKAELALRGVVVIDDMYK